MGQRTINRAKMSEMLIFGQKCSNLTCLRVQGGMREFFVGKVGIEGCA